MREEVEEETEEVEEELGLVGKQEGGGEDKEKPSGFSPSSP